MSRTAFVSMRIVLFVLLAAAIVKNGGPPSTAMADDVKGKRTSAKRKPAADKPHKTAATKDVNLLSMEFKALRALRNLEATPDQLSEIARIAKNTAGKMEKRESAKAADTYVDTLRELRDALVANDEQKIAPLQEKLDALEEKDPPDLDDEVAITDAAEIEAQRLLNMFSPQQVVAYAASLDDDLLDPVQSILDGLEEGRQLKGEEWESARDELAEKISWLVAGLNGEKALKLEEEVSKFLDRKHGEEGKHGEPKSEIRKLVGSPGPIVLLKNTLEHDLAGLLSNPQLRAATRACLRGHEPQHAAPEVAVAQTVQRNKTASVSDPPVQKPRNQKQKVTVADLDEVLSSPEKFDGQNVKMENVTITGATPARQENMLWLEVKSPAGKVVKAAMRGQDVTFIIAKADAPEAIAQMKPGTSISATMVCHLRAGPQGKHWYLRVRNVEVQASK